MSKETLGSRIDADSSAEFAPCEKSHISANRKDKMNQNSLGALTRAKIDFEAKLSTHASKLETDKFEREENSSYKMDSATENRASKIFQKRRKAR